MMIDRLIVKIFNIILALVGFVVGYPLNVVVMHSDDFLYTAGQEYKKGQKAVFREQYERLHHKYIAYILAEHGRFDGPGFIRFVYDPKYRAYYHRYWNYVSMASAGFRGRIN